MSSSAPVLVFGATGYIASSLVHQLHNSGVPVVATVRDTAKAKAKLPSGVQLVVVDFKDAASVKQAVVSSGAKRAFALMDLINKENLDALKAGGLTHLVYISTTVMELPTEPMVLQQWHTGLEGAIKGSGLTYSILRAESFMTNSFRWKAMLNSTGKTRVMLSHPDVPFRYIAFDDVATVAATALTSSQYDNRTVSIQGPQPISERQQLQAISKALSKPIEVVEVSEEEYKQKLAEFVPPPVIDSVHILQRFRQERGADWQAQTDALLTGTTTFEQFVTANKHEYSA